MLLLLLLMMMFSAICILFISNDHMWSWCFPFQTVMAINIHKLRWIIVMFPMETNGEWASYIAVNPPFLLGTVLKASSSQWPPRCVKLPLHPTGIRPKHVLPSHHNAKQSGKPKETQQSPTPKTQKKRNHNFWNISNSTTNIYPHFFPKNHSMNFLKMPQEIPQPSVPSWQAAK